MKIIKNKFHFVQDNENQIYFDIAECISNLVNRNNGEYKCKLSNLLKIANENGYNISLSAATIGKNINYISSALNKYNINTCIIKNGSGSRIYIFYNPYYAKI